MTQEKYDTANQLTKLFFHNTIHQQEVLKAYISPQQYIHENKNDLIRRGIDKPTPDLFLIAIVDKLYAEKRLVELDWKNDAVDLNNAVWFLLDNNPSSTIIMKKIDEANISDNLSIEEAFPVFNKILLQFHLALIIFSIDSDSYPLTIIEEKNLSKIQICLQQLKIGK